MKDSVRRFGSEALYRTGLLHVASWIRRRRRRHGLVLTFHCVSTPGKPYFRRGMDVSSDHFRQILEMLLRAFRVVPLDELPQALMNPERKPIVAITFDDGYRSVHDNAFPIMKELGVPATVFLPTDFIGTGRLLWWDEVYHLATSAPDTVLALAGADNPDHAVDMMKYLDPGARCKLLARMRGVAGDVAAPRRLMLDWDEIRAMHAAGLRFGGHTVSHSYLDVLGPDALRAELRGCRAVIEREIGDAPTAFAYPDGRFSKPVLAATRAAGYSVAGTTIAAPCWAGANPLLLGRIDGSLPFTAGSDHVRWPVLWSELLGIWDTLLVRRQRNPERFSRQRPRTKVPVGADQT